MSSAATQPYPDFKQLANLRARFALLDHELHVIGKAGQVVYKVRRCRQCRTYSTLHGLERFLTLLGGRF